MEHRQRAHEQNEIDDQSKICDKAWNFVVDCYADQRDDQSDQAGENTRADRIQAESRRDAALFLDAHRCLQRVLEHTRQTAGFFFSKSSRDLRVATVDSILYDGRRLDDSIKHNRKAMMNMRGCDVAELLGALRIKAQMDYPAIFFVGGTRA